MHDAEIAVTLLNRWEGANPPKVNGSSVELLREGGLCFERTVGVLAPDTGPRDLRKTIECLEFDDGSRALRVIGHAEPQERTPWAAVLPAKQPVPQE